LHPKKTVFPGLTLFIFFIFAIFYKKPPFLNSHFGIIASPIWNVLQVKAKTFHT